MDESINAATSLLPFMAINSQNSPYVNTSIISFSIIATINHLMPENFEGLTHGVKMLYSNILFSLLDIHPILGFTFSLFDLLPIFTDNKKLKKYGELLLQIPRKLIEFYAMYQIFISGKLEFYFIAVCKVIYYYERKWRIEHGRRNQFPAWHAAEHIGLYVLVKEMTGTEFSPIMCFVILLLFMVFQAIFIISVNAYIYYMSTHRMPKWVKDNKDLHSIFQNKIEGNSNSYKLHNYVLKPWLSHLKIHFITWRRLEESVAHMRQKHDFSDIDIVVGISTGGAFVGQYLAILLDKPFEIVNSKFWSGMNFPQSFIKSTKWMLGREINANIWGTLNVHGKRVLLVDDTTYTGITMKGATKYLKSNGATTVKTFVLWINSMINSPIDYYYETNQRVPIIWEWGVEID
jgi:hypoxanthine phosphoribosyltransferase